ncbi:uncharacterized protein METZ01_LOCUS432037, partial [marine metagenome]
VIKEHLEKVETQQFFTVFDISDYQGNQKL